MVQAYRFALDPTPAQERALRSHAGAARCRGPRSAGSSPSLSKSSARSWGGTPRPGSAAGVDLGVKTLLTGVDDRGRLITVAGPKPLRASLRKLRRASRAHSRQQPGSAGRRRSAARLARLHARIASLRADALHKATTALAARYETVVVEDLNVAGMVANRRLARAVFDQGFGAVRRMLGYKTAREGGRLVTADRWFPSSKRCSGCGSVKAKLTLAERVYQCGGCGLVLGRDVNAARNLLVAGRQWGGQGKCLRSGGKTRPYGRARCAEAGTRHRGRGSDRDRRPPGGYGMSTIRALNRNGYSYRGLDQGLSRYRLHRG